VHAELRHVAHGNARMIRVGHERRVRAADGRVVRDVRVAVLAADREPARGRNLSARRGVGDAWKRVPTKDLARETSAERGYRAGAYFFPGTKSLTSVSSPRGRWRWYGMAPHLTGHSAALRELRGATKSLSFYMGRLALHQCDQYWAHLEKCDSMH
jgi:hypothetical protein